MYSVSAPALAIKSSLTMMKLIGMTYILFKSKLSMIGEIFFR